MSRQSRDRPATPKRSYVSRQRAESAEATRSRILAAARDAFALMGIDRATIADIAGQAGVAAPTVYAAFGSKEGLLRALMEAALFGERFDAARRRLDGVDDPVEMIALTADIAWSVYAGESDELGLLRGASAFSPALRRLEEEFERMRFEMQAARIQRLYAEGKAKQGLESDEAHRILWMYTSRDVFRMLVQEGGWSGERYRQWLRETLLEALVEK